MNVLFQHRIAWEKAPREHQEFVILVSLIKNKVGFLLHPKRGTWEFPGGHIEPYDANWKEAIIREYREETGKNVQGILDYVFTIENIDIASGKRSYCHVFLHMTQDENPNGLVYSQEIPEPASFPASIYSQIITECLAIRDGFEGSEKTWDTLSKEYQQQSTFSITEVHYGPCIRGENTLKLLSDIRGKRVLDLGCGMGHNSLVLAKSGAEVLAIDSSHEQLQCAENLFREHGVKVQIKKQSLDNLDAGIGKFDIIFSVFALQFARDIEKVVQDSYDLLSDTGSFIISLPNTGNTFPKNEKTLLVRKDWGEHIPNMSMRYYSVPYLVELLRKSGFSHIEVLYPEYEENRANTPYFSDYHDQKLRGATVPYTVILHCQKHEKTLK